MDEKSEERRFEKKITVKISQPTVKIKSKILSFNIVLYDTIETLVTCQGRCVECLCNEFPGKEAGKILHNNHYIATFNFHVAGTTNRVTACKCDAAELHLQRILQDPYYHVTNFLLVVRGLLPCMLQFLVHSCNDKTLLEPHWVSLERSFHTCKGRE